MTSCLLVSQLGQRHPSINSVTHPLGHLPCVSLCAPRYNSEENGAVAALKEPFFPVEKTDLNQKWGVAHKTGFS